MKRKWVTKGKAKDNEKPKAKKPKAKEPNE